MSSSHSVRGFLGCLTSLIVFGSLGGWLGYVGTVLAASDQEVPPEYKNKAMPTGWRTDPTALAAGKAIYEGKANPEVNCAKCHGKDGKPTRLGRGAHDLSATGPHAKDPDDFWFWKTSEGTRGTTMPGYKNQLTEEQRWQVIAYIRSFSAKSKP